LNDSTRKSRASIRADATRDHVAAPRTEEVAERAMFARALYCRRDEHGYCCIVTLRARTALALLVSPELSVVAATTRNRFRRQPFETQKLRSIEQPHPKATATRIGVTLPRAATACGSATR
jgi:hypothetical protein